MPGRRGPNKLGADLRRVIEQAFHKAGGRDYLVQIAHKRPDVFLALVGKIIPQETRLSVLASYQAMPVPVEVRDPMPQIAQEASPAVLDAVYTVIPDRVPAATRTEAAPAVPEPSDDWLDS